VLYGTLDISKDRLKKHVFLFHDLLLIKKLLHGFVITLFSIEREVLKLLLILTIVEDGLGKNNVLVDFSV
jgi:hypothetical protein